MKKTKFILLISGIALILFGALIPAIFKSDKDILAFHRDMGHSEYTCSVTVSSNKDYEINSAIVYLEDFFGDKTIAKQISSTDITKTKVGDKYQYTFVVVYDSFGEYSEYSKVKEVELKTSIGNRIATESSFNWKIPVMIVVILIGAGLSVGGIIMFATSKAQKSSAERARKELARSNPEINTTNMTDEEVLSKYNELNSKETPNIFEEIFGAQQPKEQICAYCGSTISSDAKKCTSCGASLTKKK